MSVLGSPEDILADIAAKRRELEKMGFTDERENLYSETIGSGGTWDEAFKRASHDLPLTDEERSFPSDFLSDRYPNLFDPAEDA